MGLFKKDEKPKRPEGFIQGKMFDLKLYREEQKNDPPGKKTCVGIMAIVALLYSIAMTVLFKWRYDLAANAPMYACSHTHEWWGTSLVSRNWLMALRLSWILFLILSIASAAVVLGAWVIPARTPACGTVMLGQSLQLVMIVYILFVRFSHGGRSCSERKGLQHFREDGMFLQTMVIVMAACFIV